MNQNIYAIYDTKAHAYLQPFFLPANGVAIRAFMDCCSDPNHNFGMHPEDYHLVKLGMWYPILGEFEILPTKETLLSGLDAITSIGKEEDK